MSRQPPESDEQLLTRWRQLHILVSAEPAQVESRARELFAAYSAPERHYHSLDHLATMFQTLESVHLPEAALPEVQLAVWYHDAVYDSRSKDNEERSADVARDALTALGWSPEVRTETARLISLTRTHQTRAGDRAGQLLLDADLAILGSEEPIYDDYARAIRMEYTWVSEEAYRAGRAQLLERFLQRSRLFGTDNLYKRFEDRARRNLQRELTLLEK